jgi:hypothetical protein
MLASNGGVAGQTIANVLAQLRCGPVRPGPESKEFLRTAYHDIPLVIPVIREFWMPDRALSWSA